jgi:N-acetylglucosamine kinase-like BadF-type ATPase
MSRFVVGVDGGGTSTRAVILDDNGAEVARAECAGAVATAGVPGDAASAVADAVRLAAVQGGVTLPVRALWAGLAGAGREATRDAVTAALSRVGLAQSIEVSTDVEAALHDAFADGSGVMLIAGTGSIACARDENGVTHRVGGWGQHIGDEGSGYWIGTEALRRVARAEDGRGSATMLREFVLEALGLRDPTELVAWVASASKAEVAALVPDVARAASAGDARAGKILERAVESLAHHVTTVVERSGPWSEQPRLALGGGLIRGRGPVRAALLAAIVSHGVSVIERELDPPMGAARKALALTLPGRQ